MSDTIRVAIATEGVFRLSDEAILLCVERGMTLEPPLPEGEFQLSPDYDFFTWGEESQRHLGQRYAYSGHNLLENDFRTHPTVLGVLEELGKLAMAPWSPEERAEFKIVEIPFPSTKGWEIRDKECDSGEYICEKHRTWS